jgi:FAD/FMN-containing dehydrogenase
VRGGGDPVHEPAEALEGTPLLDVAVEDDTARRRALWPCREAHGVDVAQRRWPSLARSPDELDVIATVKHALDPQRILNPGVLLPHPGVERALVSIGGGMTCQGP